MELGRFESIASLVTPTTADPQGSGSSNRP